MALKLQIEFNACYVLKLVKMNPNTNPPHIKFEIRIGIRKIYFMSYYTEQNSHFRRIVALRDNFDNSVIKAANVVDGGGEFILVVVA